MRMRKNTEQKIVWWDLFYAVRVVSFWRQKLAQIWPRKSKNKNTQLLQLSVLLSLGKCLPANNTLTKPSLIFILIKNYKDCYKQK